eukprot:344019-Amphidinium_carterae.1
MQIPSPPGVGIAPAFKFKHTTQLQPVFGYGFALICSIFLCWSSSNVNVYTKRLRDSTIPLHPCMLQRGNGVPLLNPQAPLEFTRETVELRIRVPSSFDGGPMFARTNWMHAEFDWETLYLVCPGTFRSYMQVGLGGQGSHPDWLPRAWGPLPACKTLLSPPGDISRVVWGVHSSEFSDKLSFLYDKADGLRAQVSSPPLLPVGESSSAALGSMGKLFVASLGLDNVEACNGRLHGDLHHSFKAAKYFALDARNVTLVLDTLSSLCQWMPGNTRIIDCRDLQDMRGSRVGMGHTGMHLDILQQVKSHRDFQKIVTHVMLRLRELLPLLESGTTCHLGFACKSGRHRSVAMVTLLSAWLSDELRPQWPHR